MAQATIKLDEKNKQLICQGDWHLAEMTTLKAALQNLHWPRTGTLTIEGKEINKMDSAGAWLLVKLREKLHKQGLTTALHDFSAAQQALFSLVEKESGEITKVSQRPEPGWIARLGKTAALQLLEARDFLVFTGELTFEALRVLRRPKHLRWRAQFSVIEKTGYQALPIIALLSLMIGIVLTYQMGLQLRNYGANIFIVDLLGLAILREFAPLLTAIMVAGRTGSAFTAQLGTMRLNEEIDALSTMGITPAEVLLLPRLAGLVVALPLLTIWADIFGILGGMIMAKSMLGVTWFNFLQRFQTQIPLKALIIGLAKAPVFALAISTIGCFQGMRVSGSADNIGKQTTKSVVQAIFIIIVIDALFSILFSKWKI